MASDDDMHNEDHIQRRLYSPSEICTGLGISLSKFNALVRSGRLPIVRLDGARRVAAEDFEAFLGSLRSGSAE